MAAFNLTLEPAQIEINLKANAVFTQAYNITNNSTGPLVLYSSVSAWLPSDNQGGVHYLDTIDSSLIFSLSNTDLKLGEDFTLRAGQKKQLVLKIINSSSEIKDYYLTFFISQKPYTQIQSGQQNLAKIGSHLLITTGKDSSSLPNLAISKLNITPKIKDIFIPLTFSGEITNEGQHYSQINGKMSIYKNKQVISEQDLFPYTVIPQHSRLLMCVNSESEVTPCRLKTPVWPGKYQALITLNDDTTKYEYPFSFFVFPYTLTIFILFIFFLFTLILKKKRKNIFPH
jgi:hypothetical protein